MSTEAWATSLTNDATCRHKQARRCGRRQQDARTRRQVAREQAPAQVHCPSTQNASARIAHMQNTSAHNANMHNCIVATWAHRARSCRALASRARSRTAWPHMALAHRARIRGWLRSRVGACTIDVGPAASDDCCARTHRAHGTATHASAGSRRVLGRRMWACRGGTLWASANRACPRARMAASCCRRQQACRSGRWRCTHASRTQHGDAC